MKKFALTPEAFAPKAKTIAEPAEVIARLQQLSIDLTPELFKTTMLSGLGARREATPASPVTAEGVLQWFSNVKELRTSLLAKQWKKHDLKNCPFIISPDRSVAIVVMTGSVETGRQGQKDPTNQAEKGSVAESFVHGNNQLDLFNHTAVRAIQPLQQETQVWVLLYHYDKALKEVRYELSYPTGFGKRKITHWGERLLLGTIPDTPTTLDTIDFDKPNSPAIVDVKPKTGTY